MQIKNKLLSLAIKENDIFAFNEHIAKIKPILNNPDKNKKLILVTATSPTPAGEGKTTVSIGLNDALNALKINAIAALREPSLGPVFGAKGGANGGGCSQINPKDEIDLHFTGDFHAITTANNLIAASIDNEIYWESSLNIDHQKIIWQRCVDMNDRSLRNVTIEIDQKRNLSYQTKYNITAASDLMAIFCLAKNQQDFINKVENCIVAFDKSNKPVYVRDLKISNAILKIMEKAFMPNVVFSSEKNLALVHGGPFANIAHGCNTIIATKTAMNLADYTVTEAGFASELGAEKFLNIKVREMGIQPNVIVLVTTIRSLKMHGDNQVNTLDKLNTYHDQELLLKNGMINLLAHINNLKQFNIPLIVAINKFSTDTQKEEEILTNFLKQQDIEYSISSAFIDGSKGAIDLAKKVVQLADNDNKIKFTYQLEDSIENKIHKIVTNCYHAKGFRLSDLAKRKINECILKNPYICMSKTPLSLTDNPKQLTTIKNFEIEINDIEINSGANFLIPLAGNIFRMPGLPKDPRAKHF